MLNQAGYSRFIKSLFLCLICGILLYGCTGFSPDLLSYGEEQQRIIEDILKKGRVFSIRASAEDSLIILLDDPNPQVRLAALKIMEYNLSPKILDAVLTATLDDIDEVSVEAYRILLDNWEEARNSVLRGVNSPSASLILASVNAISRTESPDDSVYLLTLFSDYREVVRSSASRTYARLGSYENPWFQSLLKHEVPLSRLTAVKTLPRFHDPALIPVLIPFIRDEDPEIRKAALFGLSEFDSDALPFLHRTLQYSQDDELRISLLQLVEGVSDSTSIPVLISLMDDENDKISLKSVEILLGMGADLVIPVLLEQSGRMEKPALIQFFTLASKFRDVRLLPLLVSYFNSEDSELAGLAVETVRSYGLAASEYLLSRLYFSYPEQPVCLELLVDNREPLLVYDAEKKNYRTNNLFLMFEQIPQDSILLYLSEIALPSRIVNALWSLYDIETNAGLYQESKSTSGSERYPYYFNYREWEGFKLSAEASRRSSFTYLQDFFDSDEEKYLGDSRILRETADWYERGAERSFAKALKAGKTAADEDLALLNSYLESRQSLINRWRILTTDIQDLARLIFLRYSLDIETLASEYDFFRSLPGGGIPSPENF